MVVSVQKETKERKEYLLTGCMGIDTPELRVTVSVVIIIDAAW